MSNGKKILIVEDDAALMLALKDKLEAEKYHVLEAGDGVDGLAQALVEKPDLILLDIMMPRMDGINLLKNLRKDDWGKSAKVIILSNLENESSLEDAKEYGVDDYVIKASHSLEAIVKLIKERI